MQDAGQIDLVDEYGEIAPGVVLVLNPGHTPAHTSVSIRSGDDHLFLTGDAFHHPGQVAHPEWAALSDVDGEQSTATRRRILAEFVDTPTIVLGNHFAQPSMGRIVSDGSGGYIFDTTGLDA
ncbi:MBL fold metallo-hydrolase [Gordonia sp. NPDC003376]